MGASFPRPFWMTPLSWALWNCPLLLPGKWHPHAGEWGESSGCCPDLFPFFLPASTGRLSPWGAHSAGCSGLGSVLDSLPPTTPALKKNTKIHRSIASNCCCLKSKYLCFRKMWAQHWILVSYLQRGLSGKEEYLIKRKVVPSLF